MEISKSFVNYEIGGVQEDVYNNYVSKLEEAGYEFIDNKWVKDNHEIVINYDDGMIDLSLHVNDKE